MRDSILAARSVLYQVETVNSDLAAWLRVSICQYHIRNSPTDVLEEREGAGQSKIGGVVSHVLLEELTISETE